MSSTEKKADVLRLSDKMVEVPLKTAAQLREELRQAEEREAEAQRTRDEAARAAEVERRREAERAALVKFRARRDELVALVYPTALERARKAGVRVEWDGEKFKVGGEVCREALLGLESEEQRVSSSWRSRSRPTGRYLLVVGDAYLTEPRRRFPPKKDGTYNVDKVVDVVVERLTAFAARQARAMEVRSDEEAATRLAGEVRRALDCTDQTVVATFYHYDQYSGRNKYVKLVAPRGYVFYVSQSHLAVTAEEAAILHDAHRKIAALRAAKAAAKKGGSK